jgi:hypothetical protein
MQEKQKEQDKTDLDQDNKQDIQECSIHGKHDLTERCSYAAEAR